MSRVPDHILELERIDTSYGYDIQKGKKSVVRTKFSDPSTQIPSIFRYAMYSDMISAQVSGPWDKSEYECDILYQVGCVADLLFPPPYMGHQTVPIWFDQSKFSEFEDESYKTVHAFLPEEYQAWCPFRYEDLIYHSERILSALLWAANNGFTVVGQRKIIKALRFEFRGAFKELTRVETNWRMEKWSQAVHWFERGSNAIAEWLMWDYTCKTSSLFWADRMAKLESLDTTYARTRAGRGMNYQFVDADPPKEQEKEKPGGYEFV